MSARAGLRSRANPAGFHHWLLGRDADHEARVDQVRGQEEDEDPHANPALPLALYTGSSLILVQPMGKLLHLGFELVNTLLEVVLLHACLTS